MTAYLHDLGCTNDPCRCRVLYRVTESEQMSDNKHVTAERDQRPVDAIPYTSHAPALPADPRFGRGVVVRGSGE
jgi:hypothetical protein